MDQYLYDLVLYFIYSIYILLGIIYYLLAILPWISLSQVFPPFYSHIPNVFTSAFRHNHKYHFIYKDPSSLFPPSGQPPSVCLSFTHPDSDGPPLPVFFFHSSSPLSAYLTAPLCLPRRIYSFSVSHMPIFLLPLIIYPSFSQLQPRLVISYPLIMNCRLLRFFHYFSFFFCLNASSLNL